MVDLLGLTSYLAANQHQMYNNQTFGTQSMICHFQLNSIRMPEFILLFDLVVELNF